jgi:redox-sensitive bicupin YhaK (pirin superfamily)
VSNTEVAPDEVACGASPFVGVLHPRDVPLGGPRAIRVRRTLPQRERSLIGAGAGICHSEVSVPGSKPAARVLHGVQLWVALPDADRDAGRDFAHYVPSPLAVNGARVRVFLGELAGARSPVRTFTPLLGAQVDLSPGATVSFDVDPSFEHGVLLDQGTVEAGGVELDVADLWYQSPGHDSVVLTNREQRPARVLLLGGPPFGEQLVMWWNFVVRSHDEIVEYRQLWQNADDRFGAVSGYPGPRLPAPPLPNGKLRPRG